jgi:phosphatidylinositol alpha-mannosyltransferase
VATRPYKIAFVLDDSLDTFDGVQQYILTLGEWLSAQGHDVHYLVGETKRRDVPNIHSMGRNIKVRFNHNRMSIPLPVAKWRIRQLLGREEFDVIHVQMPYSPMLGGRVIKAAASQTGVVGTFHVAPHSKLVWIGNWLLRMITSRSLRRIDEIVSVSRVAQDFAWSTFGVESSIVPNTLRLERFYEARPLQQYLKTLNIVFLGRLVERKGCEYLLHAVRRLRESKQLPANCRVIICGTGPLEETLKAYVKEYHLTKKPTSRTTWPLPTLWPTPAPAVKVLALYFWKAWRRHEA